MPTVSRGHLAVALVLAMALAMSWHAVSAHAEGRSIPKLERVGADALERELLGRPSHLRFVHVWASWCLPCRGELPVLARAFARNRRGLEVVVLALDEPEADREIRRWLQAAGALRAKLRVASPRDAFPVLARLDPAWDGSVPGNYLLDARGSLVFAQRGLTVVPELVAEIDRALARE